MIGALRARSDERIYWAAIGTLIVMAWAITALLGTSGHVRRASDGAPAVPDHAVAGHDHQGTGHGHAGASEDRLPVASAFLVFVGGWTAMTTAMMLPTALPLIMLFRATVGRRPERARLMVLMIGGYLSVWTLFGVLLYFVDAAIHRAVATVPVFDAWTAYMLPLVLLAAGAYQFAPLKDRCLQECRSPLAFIAGHWRGVAPAKEALRLGTRHGVFCIGCCWTLMLVMFALGTAHLPAMLVLGAVMAIEKSMPWGRRLVVPVGAVLALSAVALVVLEALARTG